MRPLESYNRPLSSVTDTVDSPSAELCEYLPWDSGFFGVRIARVRQNRLAPSDIHTIRDWCRHHSIACLYFLSEEDPASIQAAEQNGFRLTDVRITLRAPLEQDTGSLDSRVRLAHAGDIAALRDIAAVSHGDSRFYHDEHFTHSRCADFYRTWIENSCAGWADQVYVAEHEGNVSGYITCTLTGSECKIGLIAVAGRAQGTGLGRALVARVFDWAREKNVASITVVTQGRNIGAVRFYQANGFQIEAQQRWYHLWPHEKHL